MPRSSKAPPLPPEPDINELIQNDVARIKRLLGLDVNRLAIGSEIEGIVESGIFGNLDYTIKGVNVIEFVNVSTSIGPAQGGSGFPAQVTGLTVTPQAGSNTQLNLAWTATNLPAEFNFYTVYREISSGFNANSSSSIATPTTNSYNNTGLNPGTTYYYRVSITNDAGLEGLPSSEISGTTTSPPVTTNLWLKFDGNYTDSSSFGNTITSFNSSGFVGSGQFGTNSVKLNSPTAGTDHVEVTSNTNINIDMAGKWSFSCWVYSLTNGGDFFSKFQSTNNYTNAQVYFGDLRFRVTEAGTSFGKQSGTSGSTFPLNTWNHVVGTWDGTTNTMTLYLNKVVQASTFGVGVNVENSNLMIGGHISLGNRTSEFQGRIDEFQLFKGVVLTQGQVNNLFATNAP